MEQNSVSYEDPSTPQKKQLFKKIWDSMLIYMSSKIVSEDSNLCTFDLWTNRINKTKKTLTSTNKPTSNVKTPTFQQPHAPHTPSQKITTPNFYPQTFLKKNNNPNQTL